MAKPEAEEAFAKILRTPAVAKAAQRDVLRDTLMRHRAAVDSGLDVRTLHQKDVARKRAAEARG